MKILILGVFVKVIYGNSYAERITALEAFGAGIYGTDVNGTVVVDVSVRECMMSSAG